MYIESVLRAFNILYLRWHNVFLGDYDKCL